MTLKCYNGFCWLLYFQEPIKKKNYVKQTAALDSIYCIWDSETIILIQVFNVKKNALVYYLKTLIIIIIFLDRRSFIRFNIHAGVFLYCQECLST